ncbi:MAG: HTH-type transcriptional repressor YtrA [Betaproteobacteria bacterium ADurb.Bin341]|nr:MAG: HTH-type transcriptional repressor YtrA [Betaproteobacteria bacterium ADurb.Bin341]
MPMNLAISGVSGKPIYRQLFDQISAQIVKGQLTEGFCLPPIRTVAMELRISVIPVKKAWEELERAGFIVTMVGKGCFVAPLKAHELSDKRDELALEKLKKDIEYYKALGMSADELMGLIKRYYD